MERFGDLFGGAESLDELLEQLAERMAAAEAMWQSLSPEQRDQLRQLADSLLEDMDLRWQVERLAGNLQRAVPDAGWGQGYGFTGDAPMGLGQATDMTAQLGQLDRIEDVLQSATAASSLSEIDLDDVARHLGDDAARSLDRLARLTRDLAEAGLIENRGGRTELTPQGVRRLGQRALSDLFSQMARDRLGDHQATWSGTGHDREETTQAVRVRRPVQPPPDADRPQRGPPRPGRAFPYGWPPRTSRSSRPRR